MIVDEITVYATLAIMVLTAVEAWCAVQFYKAYRHKADAEQALIDKLGRAVEKKRVETESRIKHNRSEVFAMISGEKELYR